jgi:[ribosomal protein S18]-alanine N-acetyltransferase
MRAKAREPGVRLRAGRLTDIDALLALEQAAFTTDHLSERSFRRFLSSTNAVLTVADLGGRLVGYVLVLLRPNSAIARLYSVAVASAAAGRGIGPQLIAAGETAARRRGRSVMRLEVHVQNAAAIKRYRKSGYQQFGTRRNYYDDRGDALRFEKRLVASSTGRKDSASPAAPVAR